MKHSVVAPSVGESITEVSILKWTKPDGSAVKSGEIILEIESDKATVEVIAPASGALKIIKAQGETVPVGAAIGEIDDSQKGTAQTTTPSPTSTASAPKTTPVQAAAVPTPGPAARKMAQEMGTDLSKISGTGKDGRVTKGDLLTSKTPPATAVTPVTRPGERRVPMTRLRKTIAARLVQAQHTAAILTTFNEADMKPIMDLRNRHKDSYKSRFNLPLSIMTFFGRASIEALKQIPAVNSFVDGDDVIHHDFIHLGIAVGTDRGLVVPVIRNAEHLPFTELDRAIADAATRARDGKLSIDAMSGGTFTISNGGAYGSLLSTPILNPPQSGILGMHKIMDRPIAADGQVVVRPMMYLALSYDHRLIDGKEAVTFLVTLKDFLEHPEKLGLDFTK